ncbi:MAG: hypothetical protein HY758_05035 [Nitrospirae bacterium]|nr:hypothetical protein [Nitrospirota bacterium]
MKKKNIIILIILAIITAIYYCPIINWPLGPLDEAFILVGADKILNGQIPHKDFSSEYPPGQISTLAVLFKFFGVTVMIERVYDLIIRSFLSLSVFLMIRFLASNGTALAGWVMSLIWLQHSSLPAYPVYPSVLFIFISIYFLLLHMKEQKDYYVFLSALLIVLSILFRHDLGGYAAVSITIVLISRRIAGVQSWTPLIIFIAGVVLAGLPVIIYFFMNSALGYLYNDLILLPLSMAKYQVFPYPSLSKWNLPFYVFPFVVLTGAVSSIFMIIRKKDDTTAYAILIISLIGTLFLNQARWRSDIPHLIPVALTGILLAPILLFALTKRLSLNTWPFRVVFALFIIFFGITLYSPITLIKRRLSIPNDYIVKNVNPDYERVKHLGIREDIRDTVEFIKKNTSKNDYIYVGVINHDKFNFNEPIIYFLSERDSASRYYILNTGFQTTAEVQEEMVNEFKRRPPRLALLLTRFRDEPNASRIDTKADILDNYISSNYELRETYGIYEIWMKRS